MAFIWQEYSKENRYKVSFEKISPYMEVWDTYDKKNIAVNTFFRISDLLFPVSENEPEELIRLADKYENEDNYADIANLIMHEIAQTDRLKGLDLNYIYEELERRKIESGRYGEECAVRFKAVSDPAKQRIILRYIVKYDMKKQRESMYDSVLNALFGNVRMYYENSTEHVHIYIGEEKTADNENLYLLATLLFKDVNVKTETTWEYHFGIIGFDEVMIQDEIQII